MSPTSFSSFNLYPNHKMEQKINILSLKDLMLMLNIDHIVSSFLVIRTNLKVCSLSETGDVIDKRNYKTCFEIEATTVVS